MFCNRIISGFGIFEKYTTVAATTSFFYCSSYCSRVAEYSPNYAILSIPYEELGDLDTVAGIFFCVCNTSYGPGDTLHRMTVRRLSIRSAAGNYTLH